MYIIRDGRNLLLVFDFISNSSIFNIIYFFFISPFAPVVQIPEF